MGQKLYVGGLPYSVTEEQLQELAAADPEPPEQPSVRAGHRPAALAQRPVPEPLLHDGPARLRRLEALE